MSIIFLILFWRLIFRSHQMEACFRHQTNRNITSEATFTTLEFSDYPELKVPLFFLFLAIQNFSVLWNLGMIMIIRIKPKLYSPMYYFLSHISFADFWYSTIIAPKMLVNLLAEGRSLSFAGCLAQFFLFCIFVVTELVLFAVMVYDCFVTMCKPLLYTAVMSQKLCILLVFGSYAWRVVFLDAYVFCFEVIFSGFQHNQSLLLWVTLTDITVLLWFSAQSVAPFHGCHF